MNPGNGRSPRVRFRSNDALKKSAMRKTANPHASRQKRVIYAALSALSCSLASQRTTTMSFTLHRRSVVRAAIAGEAQSGPALSLRFTLLSLLQFHVGGHRLTVTQHADFHNFANLAPTQSVGKIVEVVDWLVAELDKHIACLQSRLGRR
jgi:hypothetical protein